MKKTLLKKGVFAIAILLGLQTDVSAQASDYLGGIKIFVNGPAPIVGVKKSTNNIGAAGWGVNTPLTPFFRKYVEMVNDNVDSTNDACEVLLNDLTGKVALLYRRDCEFGAKALKAQQAGADAVIIVNNNPTEDPIGMGGGAVGTQVTIPVFMVSKNDGDAMRSRMNAGDSVFVSITEWGFGFEHDLAYASWGGPSGHAMAMPLSQFQNLSSYPEEYRFYTGGFLANLGTTDELDVTVRSEYRFNNQLVYSDTLDIDTFKVSDSVVSIYAGAFFDEFQPNGTGTLNIKHIIAGNTADDQPTDNIIEYNMAITDSIFSKGRYDFTTNEPVISTSRRLVDSANTLNPLNYVWGPLYHIEKGAGLRADAVKFALSTDTFTLESIPEDVGVYVFKWEDNNDDKVINAGTIENGGELQLIAQASIGDFTDVDSSGDVFTLNLIDNNGKRNAMLEDGADYWVCAHLTKPANWNGTANPGLVYIGTDDDNNYLGRSYAAFISSQGNVQEYAGPGFNFSIDELTGNATQIVKMIPYGYGSAFSDFSGSLAFQDTYFPNAQGAVPNITLHVSGTPNKIENVSQIASKVVLYPNPAKSEVNVQLAFVNKVKSADIRIINAIGQPVYATSISDAQSQVVTLPTSSLANGNYYVIVSDGKNAPVTRQFTIVK